MSFTTWFEAVEGHAARRPQSLAVDDPTRALSYLELLDEARRLEDWLVLQGLRPGDRIGIALRKGWREVVAMLAAARHGAVVVNLHPLMSPPQLRHVLTDADARFLLTESRRAGALALDIGALPCGAASAAADAGTELSLLRWGPGLATGAAPAAHRSLDDLAMLIYTSGSTGMPKGVMHSHRNLAAFAANVAEYLHCRPDDRVLGVLPLSFSYGLSQLLTTLTVGGCLVLPGSAMPADLLRALVERRITGLAGVPSLWGQLLEALDAHPQRFPDLRYFTNSGGALSARDCGRMAAHFAGARGYLMFGCTEALRSTYLPPEEFLAKAGAIGRPIPNVDVLVIAPDGHVCGPGESGELVHVGGHVSQGYWRRPEETARRFRELQHRGRTERAFVTGDTVRIDADGVLWFLHRAEWMVKSGGFRFSLDDVERALRASGLVAEAFAVAIDDGALGQVVHAAVSCPPGTAFDEAGLRQACRRLLPTYMTPRSFIPLSGPPPLLANGKLDRVAIRDRVQSRTRSLQTL